MTIFTELATQGPRKILNLGIKIEGIKESFVEVATSSVHTNLNANSIQCVSKIVEGATELDLEERRETAPSLDIELIDTNSLQLQNLFQVLNEYVAFVTADASAAATTINVNDTTLIAAAITAGGGSCLLYIGTETLLATATGVGTVTVTRAQHGSTAIKLKGNSTDVDGQRIYLFPPQWIGRRVTLYAYSPTTEDAIGTFIIDNTPEMLDNRKWRISCGGIIQEYFTRVVGLGVTEVQATWKAPTNYSGADTLVTLTVEDPFKFKTTAGMPTFVLVNYQDGQSIHRLHSVTTSPPEIVIYLKGEFGTGWGFGEHLREIISVKQIAIVAGNDFLPLLYLLLSDEGQGTNTWDKLAGAERQNYLDTGWRFGAKFKTTEVDTTAFTTGTAISVHNHAIIIDKEIELKEWLKEFGILSSCIFYTTADGKLSVKGIGDVRLQDATTITKNNIFSASRVKCDERQVSPILSASIGYDPMEEDFMMKEVNFIDTDLMDRYPRAQNKKQYKFRSIAPLKQRWKKSRFFNHPAGVSQGELLSDLAKLHKSIDGEPPRIIEMTVDLSLLNLRCGSLVKFSDLPTSVSELPDFKGGNFSGLVGRVISRRPDYDSAKLNLTLQLTEKTLRLCPGVKISSSVAPVTINLDPTHPASPSGNLADLFFVGCGIRIFNNASTMKYTTVAAITGANQIQIAIDFPTWGLVPTSDMFVQLDLSGTVSGTTVAGYAIDEYAAMSPDSGTCTLTNPDVETKPRWK